MGRQESFTEMMEKVYAVAQLLVKTSQAKQYGTEDLLYMNEVHTLSAIFEHPGQSLGDLAERSFRTKGSMSLMVDKLVGKGLVEKRRATEDVRRYELVPTEKGKLVAEFHRQYDRVKYGEMLDQMPEVSEETIKHCDEVLGKLIHYRLEH